MDCKIIAKRLYDYSLVLGTMDAMWDDISEDGADKYTPDLLNEYWLGLFSNNEYLGMYRFHSLSSLLLEGHVFMLPKHRGKSLDCGKAVIEWLLENLKFNKIIVNVPECFPNVINFVQKLGLEKQGYNSGCWSKNGSIVGLFQYGVLREKLECQV